MTAGITEEHSLFSFSAEKVGHLAERTGPLAERTSLLDDMISPFDNRASSVDDRMSPGAERTSPCGERTTSLAGKIMLAHKNRRIRLCNRIRRSVTWKIEGICTPGIVYTHISAANTLQLKQQAPGAKRSFNIQQGEPQLVCVSAVMLLRDDSRWQM